jgi:glucokinase
MLALTIDLGGSHVSGALMTEAGILAQHTIPATAQCFRDVLSPLEAMIGSLFSTAGVERESCSGIAFGFPGAVDCWTSRVLSTNAKFEDAIHFDFQKWAREQFGCRLVLENDARLALIGEHYHGAARGFDDAVMVLLGTGIGTAVLLGGKPLRGEKNQAGSLGGHLPIRLDGRRCTCGGIGCAEAEASTWALPAICREWPGFLQSLLATQLASQDVIDFRALFTAMDKGDLAAKAIFGHCMDVWSALTVALTHAYSPQVIVCGGGVMARATEILPALQARLNRNAWTPGGAVTIKASTLGSSAALHAAIPLLQEIVPA